MTPALGNLAVDLLFSVVYSQSWPSPSLSRSGTPFHKYGVSNFLLTKTDGQMLLGRRWPLESIQSSSISPQIHLHLHTGTKPVVKPVILSFKCHRVSNIIRTVQLVLKKAAVLMFYTINISDHHKKIKDIHVRMAINKWQFMNSDNGEASIKTMSL